MGQAGYRVARVLVPTFASECYAIGACLLTPFRVVASRRLLWTLYGAPRRTMMEPTIGTSIAVDSGP